MGWGRERERERETERQRDRGSEAGSVLTADAGTPSAGVEQANVWRAQPTSSSGAALRGPFHRYRNRGPGRWLCPRGILSLL